MEPPPFDVAAALRRMVSVYWAQFAPIVILGFLFLTLPSLFVHAIFGVAPDDASGTLVATTTAVLAMVFVASVNAGVIASLAGRALDARSFVQMAIAVAKPGVIVALVIGAVVMGAEVLRLLARLAGLGGVLINFAVYGLLVWFLICAFVALPAALAERLMPLDALRRSFALTRGNRLRLAALSAVLVLGLLPIALLVSSIVLGPAAATPEAARSAIASMTLLSPGLWIDALFSLLALGFLATAPAVIYMGLVQRRGAI